MNAQRLLSSARPLLLVGLLSASACGTFGRQPVPAPWVPGSYDFQAVIHGETITGRIEVDGEGPTDVTTSLSPCAPRLSDNYRPWSRSRTFDCAGDHRVVVTVGTKAGVPLGGSMSNTTIVSRSEVVSRTCAQYSEPDEQGSRVCVEWDERTEWVTRNVVESARILIVATGPSGTP